MPFGLGDGTGSNRSFTKSRFPYYVWLDNPVTVIFIGMGGRMFDVLLLSSSYSLVIHSI